jgi:hypothetical protein
MNLTKTTKKGKFLFFNLIAISSFILTGCSFSNVVSSSNSPTDYSNMETAQPSESALTDNGLDKLPIDLKVTIHNQGEFEKLSQIKSNIHVDILMQGAAVLDSTLNLISYTDSGKIQPLFFKNDTTYSLGGEEGEGFIGYWPKRSIITTTDEGEVAELPMYDEPLIDDHDIIVDSNDNYWFIRYPLYSCSEFPIHCGDNFKPIQVKELASCIITQIDKSGNILYNWDALEHLPLSELRYDKWAKTGDIFPSKEFSEIAAFSDPYHCNSVEVSQDGEFFMISLRHTDAVYNIRKSTGEVVWKLGGKFWPGKSLTVEQSKDFGGADLFSGQHDARFITPTVVSVFDNSTGLDRPARGFIFTIDELNKSATVDAVMNDPTGFSSNCTGSFRILPGSDFWIAGWGCSPNSITIFTKNGTPVVSLAPADSQRNTKLFTDSWPPAQEKFLNGFISYRVTPDTRFN